MKRICSLRQSPTSKSWPFRYEPNRFLLFPQTILGSLWNELGMHKLRSSKRWASLQLDHLKTRKCKLLVSSRPVCWSVSSRLSQWRSSQRSAQMTKQLHPKHPCLKGTFSYTRKFSCRQLKFLSLGQFFSKFWQLQLGINRLLSHLKSWLNQWDRE